jgi:GNAT superfamily N-acetyltransferase
MRRSRATDAGERQYRCVAEEILIRAAAQSDASDVAAVWLAAFRETYAFPPAHAAAEVRQWVRSGLLPSTQTWVAEAAGSVVGFLSLRESSVEQLYVRQPWTGKGIGSRLLTLAKERHPAGLELWTFHVNAGARRFYERHGFRAVEMTDGAANEERQPDVRYVWAGVS